MSSTAEVFAAMGEAVAGSGGKALQRKFKVCDMEQGLNIVSILTFIYLLLHLIQHLHNHILGNCIRNWVTNCNINTIQGKVTFTITPENKTYSLDLSSPSSSVSEGDSFDGKADLAVTCSEEIMMKMIKKEIQPQQAFMKGMLKIKGKMALAMKLTNVLAATRKKLPQAKL